MQDSDEIAVDDRAVVGHAALVERLARRPGETITRSAFLEPARSLRTDSAE